ncbi:hypothetical protein PC128_g26824 [Phytophthora cactorum]|nr:hypothetical protein PC128_g26824 [Phytophthora cactorum]
MLGTVAFSLCGGGSTVASEQPQKGADIDPVSAMTTRRQAASRSGKETTDKNYGSVQGTDGAQAGPAAGKNAVLKKPFSSQAMDFAHRRQAVIRFVQDAIAASVDRQKLNADNVGRGNTNEFEKGSLVLVATQNLPRHAVSCGVVISRRSLTTISEQGQDYLQVAQATNPRSCDRKRPRGAKDSTRSLPKTRRCSIMAKMSFKEGCPYC